MAPSGAIFFGGTVQRPDKLNKCFLSRPVIDPNCQLAAKTGFGELAPFKNYA